MPAILNQQPSARRLEGKIALVTGAGRGIGRGIALCLAEEGADMVINDLPPAPAQPPTRSHRARDRGAGSPGAGTVRRLSNRAQVEAMVARSRHALWPPRHRRIQRGVIRSASDDRGAGWDGVRRTIEVTQFGVFHTCQFAARQMVAQGGGGKIVIIGSLLAELPYETSAAYNMAKAAVNHFGRTLANELAPHHINVNVINPGYIDTPGERKFATEADLERSAQSSRGAAGDAARHRPFGCLSVQRRRRLYLGQHHRHRRGVQGRSAAAQRRHVQRSRNHLDVTKSRFHCPSLSLLMSMPGITGQHPKAV